MKKPVLLASFMTAVAAATNLSLQAAIQPSDDSHKDTEHGGPPEIAVHELNPYAGVSIVAGQSGHYNRFGGGGNGISYHGGPIIAGGVHAYLIWYGNWSGNSATAIIPAFLNSLGGSRYYNINTTYYNGAGAHVLNSVVPSGQTSISQYPAGASSYSTSLSDSDIQSIVSLAIANGGLGSTSPDAQGVYFVLTSSDVNETSGFCTQYCGWHTYYGSGAGVKYAFVGNPDRCPSACEAQTAKSPNGNTGADGMVSIIAHELEEANTDPELNAWYDSRGYENADKCAWTFGTVYTASNGSYYNITLGSSQYLIQRNWVNASGGYCSMSY